MPEVLRSRRAVMLRGGLSCSEPGSHQGALGQISVSSLVGLVRSCLVLSCFAGCFGMWVDVGLLIWVSLSDRAGLFNSCRRSDGGDLCFYLRRFVSWEETLGVSKLLQNPSVRDASLPGCHLLLLDPNPGRGVRLTPPVPWHAASPAVPWLLAGVQSPSSALQKQAQACAAHPCSTAAAEALRGGRFP